MGRIRTIKMRFDLSDPDDALAYRKLKESSKRAFRVSIAAQAHYLLVVMLGVRLFKGVGDTGLENVPDFHAQMRAWRTMTKAAVEKVAEEMVKRRLHAKQAPPLTSRRQHAQQLNREA
jgi:hypothetical protein